MKLKPSSRAFSVPDHSEPSIVCTLVRGRGIRAERYDVHTRGCVERLLGYVYWSSEERGYTFVSQEALATDHVLEIGRFLTAAATFRAMTR